jgi:hypothetical protein
MPIDDIVATTFEAVTTVLSFTAHSTSQLQDGVFNLLALFATRSVT